MKKVVSIIISRKIENVPSEPDGTELLYTDENRSFEEIVQSGIKQAKGKYVFIVDGGFEFCDIAALTETATAKNADILEFNGATAFKLPVLKSVNICGNYGFVKILTALNSKNIEHSDFKPFMCDAASVQADGYAYSEKYEKEFLIILQNFKKNKAKLAKDVYSYVFDAICTQLEKFYMIAMLAVHNGEIPSEKIIEFDTQLKQNVVLYLAMDKRFTCANLNKLRKNCFKISFLTAKKFKKHLNI